MGGIYYGANVYPAGISANRRIEKEGGKPVILKDLLQLKERNTNRGDYWLKRMRAVENNYNSTRIVTSSATTEGYVLRVSNDTGDISIDLT